MINEETSLQVGPTKRIEPRKQGLMLKNGYFELHTRSFPWERYRLAENASPKEAD